MIIRQSHQETPAPSSLTAYSSGVTFSTSNTTASKLFFSSPLSLRDSELLLLWKNSYQVIDETERIFFLMTKLDNVKCFFTNTNITRCVRTLRGPPVAPYMNVNQSLYNHFVNCICNWIVSRDFCYSKRKKGRISSQTLTLLSMFVSKIKTEGRRLSIVCVTDTAHNVFP